MKRAIAHKDYVVKGGGEHVAEHLCSIFNSDMYVGRYCEENVPDDFNQNIKEIDHSTLFKKAIDFGSAPRSLSYMWSWQYVPEMAKYDTIITSGNEPLWYVREPRQTVVSYCHSPPRFQYDRFQDGYGEGPLQRGYSMVVRMLLGTNRLNPDLWIANSDLVKRRIMTSWGISEDNIKVCYPPVDVESYDPSQDKNESYFFHLGRLEEMKRVDEIVEAFDGLDETLKIAGKGTAEEKLKQMAGDNVEMLGYISEEEKYELMAGADAFIFNAENEDFGLVPIESMAAGTPVIGVKEGFTREQIHHRKNGILYDRSAKNLREAINSFRKEGVSWSPEEIASEADQYSSERFSKEMKEYVEFAERKSGM